MYWYKIVFKIITLGEKLEETLAKHYAFILRENIQMYYSAFCSQLC